MDEQSEYDFLDLLFGQIICHNDRIWMDYALRHDCKELPGIERIFHIPCIQKASLQCALLGALSDWTSQRILFHNVHIYAPQQVASSKELLHLMLNFHSDQFPEVQASLSCPSSFVSSPSRPEDQMPPIFF